MARRKKSGGDEESGANWMDTYGDLVTLLLCFFVLLFSFSSMDAAKWEALVGAFSGSKSISIIGMTPEMAFQPAINDPITGVSSSKQNDEGDIVRDNEVYQQLVSNILDHFGSNSNVEILQDEEAFRVTVRFPSSVLFDSGQYVIRRDAYETLNNMAVMLGENIQQDLISVIDIEGHTDNVPYAAGVLRDNRDLSVMRANNVVRYLLARSTGIPTNQIFSRGYGEELPIAPNDTDANKERNRRVEFVIESYRTKSN